MGESRSELLHWLNSLLQLNITKVEQCGTGAALCQVFDSIYRECPHVELEHEKAPLLTQVTVDIPMSRVKFNVNTEYAYLQNFKILQNCFTRHHVDRTVPIESLVKCKMQDNLEFLQWSKRYWDQHFPDHEYDAIARRKASGAPTAAPTAPSAGRASATGARRTGATANTASRVAPRTSAAAAGGVAAGGAAAAALRQENETMKEAITGLEKERDFYFSKLRDIELLIQAAIEQEPDLDKDEDGLVKQIQAILYSTEEGFEIPLEAEGDPNGLEEPETF